MNVKTFFKQYPAAKSLWKVGDKVWLHYAKAKAEMHAALTGQELEELTKPAAKQTKAKNVSSDGVE